MTDFNTVVLAGRLTREVETRFTNKGTQITNFSLCVNRRYTIEGERREDPMFIDCAAFGKLAEIVAEYLSKGSPVLISGRLEWRQWETPEGQKRSKHSVICERVEFLGRREDGTGATADGEPTDNDDIPF
jgi:single-strand DNA-binding protein